MKSIILLNTVIIHVDLERYSIDNLWKAIHQPRKFLNEFRRLSQFLKRKLVINRMYRGENFIDDDWDNLVILDACRPDFFEEYNTFDGELSRRTSLGASSNEFFIHTFRGKQYHDTVYVTGNTSIEGINEDSLHRIVKTYADTYDYHKGWLPETTLEVALKTYEKYLNKRLVVHFMQPHTPYLGERADKLRQEVVDEHGVGFRYMSVMDMEEERNVDKQIADLLSAFERGYISRDELNKVYAENLCYVFEYVEELLDNIEGKTIITSDHSESLGDFNGIYGHMDYALSSELREVPWLVIDGNRRNTFAEPPIEPASVDEKIIRENLRDLGYL